MPELDTLALRPGPAPAGDGPARGLNCGQAIDVSVCIVNWNGVEVLRACLRSLAEEAQGRGLEIIVVDNGSSDGSAELVRREFPGVQMVRNGENRGFARANNQAARLARGRYLLFLNNDTRVPPAAVRRLADFMDANPDVGMAGPRLRDEHGRVQVSWRPRPTLPALLHRTNLFRWSGIFRRAYLRYRRAHFDAHTIRQVDVLMGAAVMMPRERFWEWGGWDEDFLFGGDDMELSHRVSQHARIVYFPEVDIIHLGRESTRRNIAFTAREIPIGLVRYLRKTGTSGGAVFLYKLAMTLEAPLQLVEKTGQYLWRRARRQNAMAHNSLLSVRGVAHFLFHGLVPFWKA
jgi:N-acetylglucosaminyl-diphospho-decaprenol L-rhamnosyltransferase